MSRLFKSWCIFDLHVCCALCTLAALGALPLGTAIGDLQEVLCGNPAYCVKTSGAPGMLDSTLPRGAFRASKAELNSGSILSNFSAPPSFSSVASCTAASRSTSLFSPISTTMVSSGTFAQPHLPAFRVSAVPACLSRLLHGLVFDGRFGAHFQTSLLACFLSMTGVLPRWHERLAYRDLPALGKAVVK